MKRALAKFRNSAFRNFLRKHKKYAPILFFIAGFIVDTLTLGRIDGAYVLVILCLHMSSLTVAIYLYNLVDDGKWKNTILENYEEFLPLAIQFFFGGLSSAYVIYFARSVSLSKTVSFFIILLVLLFANELLKKRISNKYLQFSVYFFISFTFFTFITPVIIREMNHYVFIFSGLLSLVSTFLLIIIIYRVSPSTRAELRLGKLVGLVLTIYCLINVFYFFKLIPPVPLALENGVVAHSVKYENNKYVVTYETDDWFVFWRKHRHHFVHHPEDNVYVFSSIFAPTNLKKSIFHRWKWYNQKSEDWQFVEDIGYDITGGRDGGFRGYTYKNNVWEGLWKVEVITEEELILGVIEFEIMTSKTLKPQRLIEQRF